MRTLLLLLLLLLIFVAPVDGQTSTGAADGSAVVVLGFKWAKSRQVLAPLNPSTSAVVPAAAAMIPANKILERNAREQTSPGMRDLAGATGNQ